MSYLFLKRATLMFSRQDRAGFTSNNRSASCEWERRDGGDFYEENTIFFVLN